MFQWIPNFISSEECALLIKMGRDHAHQKSMLAQNTILDEGYKRSTDIMPSEGSKLEAMIQDLDQLIADKIKESTNLDQVECERQGNFYEYTTGGFYRAHSDCQVVRVVDNQFLAHQYVKRDIASVLYLNDDFEGGELTFVHDWGKVMPKVKPQTGALLLFKCNWEFDHYVLPVTGNRYCIANWYRTDPSLIEEVEFVPNPWSEKYPLWKVACGDVPKQSQFDRD